ncbi:MAG: efflux RND transporter periplasmic adaptor subunit, partial [Sphingobacteriales bacterium]
MDRELSSSFKTKRRLKLLTLIGLSVVMVVALIAVGRILLQPTIKRGSFDIVIAQMGTVEETIAASGLVVPEYEYLITSPIHSKIERVLLHAGEAVEAGEPILQLYLGETQNDYNKLLDEQAANHNRAEQLKLNLEGTLTDINT